MRSIFNRRRVAVGAAAAAIALGAGTVFAYWTTTGSGTGSGAAASSNGTVVLSATVPGGIYPGGHVTVPVSATTSAGTDLYVTSVSLGTPAITVTNAYDASTNATGCKASDFSFDLTGVSSNVVVAHGAIPTSLGSGTLTFANDPANSQDGCKGVTVTVHLTSN